MSDERSFDDDIEFANELLPLADGPRRFPPEARDHLRNSMVETLRQDLRVQPRRDVVIIASSNERTPPRRRLLLLAAACLAVVSFGGLYALVDRPRQPAPSNTVPAPTVVSTTALCSQIRGIAVEVGLLVRAVPVGEMDANRVTALADALEELARRTDDDERADYRDSADRVRLVGTTIDARRSDEQIEVAAAAARELLTQAIESGDACR